jgi:hypothetical protein
MGVLVAPYDTPAEFDRALARRLEVQRPRLAFLEKHTKPSLRVAAEDLHAVTSAVEVLAYAPRPPEKEALRTTARVASWLPARLWALSVLTVEAAA